MKFNLPKALLTAGALSMLLFWGNACKKNTASVDKQSPSADDALIESIKKRMIAENPGITTIIPFQEKIKLDLLDKNGHIITLSNILTTLSSSKKVTGTYNCDLPGVINPYALFDFAARRFECGSGFKYTIGYTVSAPLNIIAANPYFPTITSNGSIKLKMNNLVDNSTANVVYSETNLPVTILSLGDDPGNPDNFLFRCSFTTSFISNTTIVAGPWLEPKAVFATDCDQYPGIGSGPITRYLVYNTSVNPNGAPCNRTDKCFINPTSAGGLDPTANPDTVITLKGSLAGSDVTGLCASQGVTVADFSDFEYRVVTGYTATQWQTTGTPGVWLVAPVTSSFGAPVANPQGTLAYWDVQTLPKNPFMNGVFEFHYRNRMVTGTGAPCTGAWSAPERYMFYKY